MPSLPSSSRRLCAPSQDTREGCTVLNFSSFRGVCEVAQEQIEKAQKLETMLRGTHSQFQSICTVSPGLAQAPSSSRDDKGLRGLGSFAQMTSPAFQLMTWRLGLLEGAEIVEMLFAGLWLVPRSNQSWPHHHRRLPLEHRKADANRTCSALLSSQLRSRKDRHARLARLLIAASEMME